MKLLEAVPNFSLGKNVRVFKDLKQVLVGGPAELLDYSRDIDHNRTVATLAGTPAQLEKTILAAVALVIDLVDISCHRGVHPCLGATDVVPFIPLKNSVMSDAVALAEKTGGKIARRFGIPVFLYAHAARQSGRRNLERIRRGGLVSLKSRIETPEGAPDFGPKAVHKTAGALVIGARDFLIAFNINFASRNLDAVKKIAAAIREKNDGLPGIKAIGLPLETKKCVQVSVNICDFKKTGLVELMTEIRKLAKIYKMKIKNSEIIGLVPAAAITGLDPEFLVLPGAGKKGHGFKNVYQGLLYKWR